MERNPLIKNKPQSNHNPMLDVTDFIEQLEATDPSMAYAFCVEHSVILDTYIQNATNFQEVLGCLNKPYKTAVYESVKTRLSSLITVGFDFMTVLYELNQSQRSEVYQSVNVKSIIKRSWDFKRVLQYLNQEERNSVYELFKDDWSGILTNALDFKLVFAYLTPEQKIQVGELFKNDWSRIISNAYGFKLVFANLTSEQRIMVFKEVKDKLGPMINDTQSFEWIIEHLNEFQIHEIYVLVKDRFPAIITDGPSYMAIIASLLTKITPRNPSEIRGFNESIYKDLKLTSKDLNYILKRLLNDEKKAFIEGVILAYPAEGNNKGHKCTYKTSITNAVMCYFSNKNPTKEQYEILRNSVWEASKAIRPIAEAERDYPTLNLIVQVLLFVATLGIPFAYKYYETGSYNYTIGLFKSAGEKRLDDIQQLINNIPR